MLKILTCGDIQEPLTTNHSTFENIVKHLNIQKCYPGQTSR